MFACRGPSKTLLDLIGCGELRRDGGVTSHTTWLLLLHPQSQDLHQPHLLALRCLSLPLLPGSASWAPWWPWAWTTGKLQTIAPAFTCPTCSLQSSSWSHPGLSPHCFLSGPHSSPFPPPTLKRPGLSQGHRIAPQLACHVDSASFCWNVLGTSGVRVEGCFPQLDGELLDCPIHPDYSSWYLCSGICPQ